MSNSSNTQQVSKRFSGLETTLTTGSRQKKALSNNLEIRANDLRNEVCMRLTLRQARALKRFLNDRLD